MDNRALSQALTEMADLLDIEEANPFRIRAYRNASRVVFEQTRGIAERVAAGEDLKQLPGIGKDIAAQLEELVRTGKSSTLEEMFGRVPRGVLELLRLPALGPKKAKKLWQELGVTSLAQLGEAAREGRVAGLAGFGAATQKKILENLEKSAARERRLGVAAADALVAALCAHLEGTSGLERLEPAGSFRRRKESVGDLDFVATVANDAAEAVAALMDRFVAYPGVVAIEGRGETKASVRLAASEGLGFQVDLRVVPRRSFGAAWIYFTGSKDHNIKLRQRAVERELRLSEYGLFRGGEVETEGAFAGEFIAGVTEEEVYRALDLVWVPPELREDRGELKAAARGALPRLVERADLRGDLQMHTTWSDGKNTLEEMARACVERGLDYCAFTDHSPALAMIRGLDAERVKLQAAEIQAVQRKLAAEGSTFRILRSCEVDIRADGSLDLDDATLRTLDLVLVSIHSRFELPAEEQTARILAALDHPLVQILAHPTGRKIGRRDSMRFDLDRVLERAVERGVAVELDSHPDRLDLSDTALVRARELGAKIVISTDAHRVAHLDHARYGVEQARRAWLEPRHVLNTLPVDEFLAALRPRLPGN
jgi:DNA polymerase (family 10)